MLSSINHLLCQNYYNLIYQYITTQTVKTKNAIVFDSETLKVRYRTFLKKQPF